MSRITLSLCAMVCLLVTSDWLVPMTSCMLVDVVTNYDSAMTSKDPQELSSEALRLARVLLQSPRYSSRLESSSMGHGYLHPSLLSAKRNTIDPFVIFPNLAIIGRK